MYYSTIYSSPIGDLTLASDSGGTYLVGLWMAGQKYYGGTLQAALTPADGIPLFGTIKKWLDRYFAGEKPDSSKLPLAPIGSDFRQAVWEILRTIPYGEVTTYAEVARKTAARLGRERMSTQAVGGAVGHNPISILIPCHRVVGSNGSLTGYAAGLETKIKLLELEGVDLSRLWVPKKGTAR